MCDNNFMLFMFEIEPMFLHSLGLTSLLLEVDIRVVRVLILKAL